MHPPEYSRPNNKLNQLQTPLPRSAKIHPKHLFQFHPPAFLIVPEHLTLTKQFSAELLKDNIPDHKEIITGPLTIIPEYFEWSPLHVSLIMGFSTGIGSVAVIVPDVLNLFEICL